MRRKTGSSTKKNKPRRDNGARKKSKDVPVDQLIASAESSMAALDVERAAQFYSQAVFKLQNTARGTQQTELLVHVFGKMGECKVSMGDPEGARHDFQQSIALLEENEQRDSMAYHETRSNLYLYAGQLCMEQEALETYKKGIQSLEACLALTQRTTTDAAMADNDNNDDTEKVLNQKLSGAYCTVAELYLTDLCYDENAETECESYLDKALQIKDSDGEPMVDALQTMASLRLSQKPRQLEAVPYILRAFDKMKVGSEALAALVGLAENSSDESEPKEEGATELKEVDAANNLPEFEFRCQTAKLLLECAALLKDSSPAAAASTEPSQEDQCISAAISVLGSLLAQNDEVVEIWYLAGCAFAAKRPPLADPARFYLDRAMQMLQDIKKALEQEVKFADQEDIDELREQLEENQVQIEDVHSKLAELGEVEPEDATTMEEG